MLVCINGNIGAGKSTLMTLLEKQGHKVVLEGIDRSTWGTLLDDYYRDPHRYAFLFQMVVLMDLKKVFDSIKDDPTPLIFIERSVVDCLAFAMLIHKETKMSDTEFATFKQVYETLECLPHLIITLDLPCETCVDRIRHRGRECELGITLEYLRGVEEMTTLAHETCSDVPQRSIKVADRTPQSIVEEVLSVCCFHKSEKK